MLARVNGELKPIDAPSKDDDAVPMDRFAAEVANGLPNEQRRLSDAKEAQGWYDFDSDQYLPKRDSESDFDFEARPKRDSGLVHECVEVLCDHLYNPGPTRTVAENPEADEFLRRVYEQNLFNHLMQQADILSTLNEVCAIQIDAGEGEFDEKPICLTIWGADEFHAWTSPHDPRKVIAVVTLDVFDMQETRRLWNDEEVWTFKSEKLKSGQTAGGRVANLVSKEKHGYGCIPFAFTHYELPVRSFYPASVGSLLVKAQKRVDDRLSRLDESIQKHLNPIPVAEGVDPNWNPVLEPGRFVRLVPPAFSGITGDYSMTPSMPKLSYLQVTLDIVNVWEDLTRYINQILDACRVPLSYARMEQSGVASGISLIVEQAPLMNRARKRRVPYTFYETEIAKKILMCAGNHYGVPGLVSACETLVLNVNWPEPSISIPGTDRDEADKFRIENGLASLTMIVQERHGYSRDQAWEHIEQVAEDRSREKEIFAKYGLQLVGPAGGPPEDQGDQSPDQEEKNEGEEPPVANAESKASEEQD